MVDPRKKFEQRLELLHKRHKHSACAEFCAFVEGTALFLFEALLKAKTASRVARFFRQEKYL